MESIFLFQPVNRFAVAKFDLIISILLVFFIIANFILFEKTKRLLSNSILVIVFAVIPFEFIFLSVFGHELSFIISLVLYILTIVHLIALIITFRFLGSKFVSFSKENGLGYGIIAITIIFIVGSILFFIFEGNSNPGVTVFEDSIWVSLVFITTTGYGDITPITIPGKIVSGVLMISGVSFATFATASLAGSIFVRLRKERISREKKMEEYNKKLVETSEKIKKNWLKLNK
ncbi:Hyperpolarization-activated voltage-gated potassium channel [Candidatus Methanobinarius endosymbioticus]|uniref:Hyperpolarization-activated voltage-gated potassium channel n=1 Tax=Candidatus Methanobinarius endosymbioticus TaxID=2006182 RepID=A0A366MBN7_9EURY|nr:Hyperpolarization-activated voltage-gated potassium channel [Candidatus Methanobinarius endosymbioticus]